MTEIDPFSWSSNFFLKWSDFQAEHNPALFEDSHSTVKYRFTWIVNSDTLDDQIIFLIENISLFVEFHPLLSSVRSSQANNDLLKHEQGHFDLAELEKNENLEKLQYKFYNKPFPTRGHNDDQRKQFAKEDSGKMIVNEIEKLEQLLDIRRQKYNKETDFGQNKEKQLEYNLIFDKLRQ
jgi:hypothetical protein